MNIIKNLTDLRHNRKFKKFSDESIDDLRVGLIDVKGKESRDELEALVSGTEKKMDENLLDTMVPYADMMTLLLVFFVFFFIISSYEKSDSPVEEHAQYELAQVDSLFDLNEKTVTIPSEILFETGQAELKWGAVRALNEIAESIKEVFHDEPGWDVRVEGYTDNVPIYNDDFKSNWELSTARAISVVRFFVENDHFPPDQLQAMGYGEFKPLVPNDSRENRNKNRRVEIKINKIYGEIRK